MGANNEPWTACFASSYSLTPGTTYSISVGQSGDGGDASNYYRFYNSPYHADADAYPLLPMWNGSANSMFRARVYNGTSWSYVTDKLVPFALLGEMGAPFANAGAAGGPHGWMY